MRTTVAGRKTATAAADAEVEALGQQIVELLERVRLSEERTAYAEQQLVHMTHMANAAAAAAEAVPARVAEIEFAAAKPTPTPWLAWTLVGVVAAIAGAGFVLGYSPLRTQYEAALKQNQDQTAQTAQEMNRLRASFGEERDRLESQLAAAQTAAVAAIAVPAAPASDVPEAKSSRSSGSEHSSDASEARAAKSEERKAERLAKREERLAKSEARKAERAAKAEERKAKRGSSSDDEDDSSSASKPKKSEAKPSASSGGGGDDPLEGLGDDNL
jgi:hypothetical protein